MTRAQMNMDMAELQKIQTDQGPSSQTDKIQSLFPTHNQKKLNLTKCCKQGYKAPVYSSLFKTPVHLWRK